VDSLTEDSAVVGLVVATILSAAQGLWVLAAAIGPWRGGATADAA